jgi:membrane protease YdiL (CAAX protease family)
VEVQFTPQDTTGRIEGYDQIVAGAEAVKSDSTGDWTVSSALLVGLAGFASFLLALIVLLAWGRNFLPSRLSRSELSALQVIVLCLVAAVIGYSAVKFVRRRAEEDFWKSIEWRQSASQIAMYGTVGICSSIIMRYAMTGRLAIRLNNGVGVNKLFLLIFIGTVILQPMIEEVYFRGILFCGLKSRFNPVASISIVTLIFVALHARHQWIVLPISIVLGTVRLVSRSTCSGFALHLTYNLGVLLWGIR